MAQAHGASVVLLAHHAQDQAETFLLQALRGAGVAGLSAMPMAAERGGICWLRPWLHRSRSEVQSYIDHHRLTHIEDDSNADTRFARNRLRLDVWPSLQQAFPDATTSLSQSAAHLADAQACLASWLEGLWPTLTDAKGQLSLAAWCQLPAPAQRMVLLAWAQQVADQGLSRGWVGRLQQEWLALPRSGTRWPMARGEVRLYRGWLFWRADEADHDSGQGLDATASWPCTIRRAGRHLLPAGQGVVLVKRVKQGGLPLSMLAQAVWRLRQGGEQFQLGPDRPARSLKKQFQQQGVPAWARSGPLLWAGEQLLFVPSLGEDARAQAQPGEARVTLQWLPLAGQGAPHLEK
jgi:tRNA(Ile)-lysidine synthase